MGVRPVPYGPVSRSLCYHTSDHACTVFAVTFSLGPFVSVLNTGLRISTARISATSTDQILPPCLPSEPGGHCWTWHEECERPGLQDSQSAVCFPFG